MAYCVRCGVKLEPGSSSCPLCNTPVAAPQEIIGHSTQTIFPSKTNDKFELKPWYDKQRKGFIELIVALAVIAVITLSITGFAIKDPTFQPWFAIGCVVIGVGFILAPFVMPTRYPILASAYSILTIALLFFIDAQIQIWDWSLYANSSIALFWILGVFPWILKKHRWNIAIPVGTLAIPAFLLFIDAMEGNGLEWFVPVALPVYAVVVVSCAIAYIRFRKGMTISETVLASILIICIGVGSSNVFALLYKQANEFITWSSSLWIVAACLSVYLLSVATIRKVRLFFTNKIHK